MAWIEAAEIHAPRAGMRARAVERLDPAAIAEKMRRDTGPEAVFDKHFGPAQEGKRGFIDDKV